MQGMRKIRAYFGRLTPRTRFMIVYFIVMGIVNSAFTRLANGIHGVFLVPAMLIMAAFAMRDEGLKRDVPMLFGCAAVTWAVLAGLLNGILYTEGNAIGYLALAACWFFTLRLPRGMTDAQMEDEFIAVGVTYMVCYLPFLLVALYSLFSGRLIHTPLDYQALGLETAGFLKDRLRVLENQNVCGRNMLMCILFSIFLLIRRKKAGWRIFSIFVLVVNLMALTHTQSRNSILSLAIGIGVIAFRYVYMWIRRRGVRVIAGLAACAAAFFLVVGITNVLFDADVAIARKTAVVIDEEMMQQDSYVERFGQFDPGSSGREWVWKITVEYLKTHPKQLLLGINSPNIMKEIGTVDSYVSGLQHVHNSLLDCVVRCGLPFLLIILAFLVYMVPKCWRVITKPGGDDGSQVYLAMLVSLLAASMMEVMLFARWSPHNTMFMLMCGYVLQICKRADEKKQVTSSNSGDGGNLPETAAV